MALVTVYTGAPDLLQSVEADLVVAVVAGYVSTYDHMARALHAGTPLVVAVSNPSVAAWLRKMQERYGSDRIAFEELTRRGRLQSQWGIPIPNWVTDYQIEQAGLLDVKLEAPPGRSFEDFILDVYFSPYLAQTVLPLSQLDDLVVGYDARRWAEHSQRPLIGDILQNRLRQWEQKAEHEGERLLIRWLRDSPAELGQQLALYKALNS